MTDAPTMANMLAHLEHARHANRLHVSFPAPRQWGKSLRDNDLLCLRATRNGGVPERPVIVETRDAYIIWEPTGEVRTVLKDKAP